MQLFLCRDFIKEIGPPLHHFPSLWQVLSVIVCGTNLIAFGVSKLAFDHIGRKAVLIQNGTGCAAEPVARGARMISHPVKRIKYGVLTHKLRWVMLVWENRISIAGVILQFPKNCNGLLRQRHDVKLSHLHTLSGDSPLGFVPINFGPLCRA